MRTRVGIIARIAGATMLFGLTAGALSACSSTSQGAPPSPHPGCTLPTGAGPQVRIANFVPNADVVDVCIRASAGSWGAPLILDGADCANGSGFFTSAATAGFAYGQVSIAFTAPADTVDVKLVAAGTSCSAPALTEADGMKLSAQAVTTLLRVGGAAGVPQKIEALPENSPQNSTGTDLRFVHAMPGTAPLDFGLAPDGVTQLPTVVATNVVANPIAFGETPQSGEMTMFGKAPVTNDGYVPIAQGIFNLVAGVHGTSPEKAVLLYNLLPQNGISETLYAVGLPGSNAYPPAAYMCAESQAPVAGANPLLLNCVK